MTLLVIVMIVAVSCSFASGVAQPTQASYAVNLNSFALQVTYPATGPGGQSVNVGSLQCPSGFITHSNSTSVIWPCPFVGANQASFMDFPIFAGSTSWNLIQSAFATAQQTGITVLRLFLDEAVDCPPPHNITARLCNDYADRMEQNFPYRMAFYDRVIATAATYHVRILAVLADFVGYDPTALSWWFSHHPFVNITDSQVVQAYRDYIKEVLTWKNTITGVTYRDDPTIFAWDVANEPQLRQLGQTCAEFGLWLANITTYVKELDPNHLITIGGLVSGGDQLLSPSCMDALRTPSLDFISLHYYLPVAAVSKWPSLSQTVRDFLALGKPVIIEEFDVTLGSRPPPPLPDWYVKDFNASLNSAFCAGASGVLFWGWSDPQTYSWPIYWAHEDHSTNDTALVSLLANYRFPFPLNVTSAYGTITGTGCYSQGTERTVSPTAPIVNTSAGTREVFAGWQGMGNGSYTGSNQTAKVTMDGPISETAKWTRQYKIIIQQTPGGSVIASQQGPWLDAGANVTLTANAEQSYEFEGWFVKDSLVSSTPTYTFELDSPMNITATFTPLATIPISWYESAQPLPFLSVALLVVVVIVASVVLWRKHVSRRSDRTVEPVGSQHS